MTQYEYKVVSLRKHDYPDLTEANELGAQGWRMVPGTVDNNFFSTVLMERETQTSPRG